MKKRQAIGLLAAAAVTTLATTVGAQFGAQAAPISAPAAPDAAPAAALGTTALPQHRPRKPTKKPLAGLRILISNDDSMQAARENGKDGIGLYDMRKSLCAAGADVVVVAP